MDQYLLGLITIPVIAAVGYIVFILGAKAIVGLHGWWLRPDEIDDWKKRATHASCVLVARRVWTLKLPGSRLLVFRSTVGGTDYRYGTYFGDTSQLQERAWAVLMDEFDPR